MHLFRLVGHQLKSELWCIPANLTKKFKDSNYTLQFGLLGGVPSCLAANANHVKVLTVLVAIQGNVVGKRSGLDKL